MKALRSWVFMVTACATTGCIGPSRTTMADTNNTAMASAREQLSGTVPLEPGTGMWKVRYNGQVHRWLIVRRGATLHIAPARHWGEWESDYYTGTPTPDGGGQVWQLQHHICGGMFGQTSPNTAELTFDPGCREMKVVWANIIKHGGLEGVLRGTTEGEDVVGNGTIGAWPNL